MTCAWAGTDQSDSEIGKNVLDCKSSGYGVELTMALLKTNPGKRDCEPPTWKLQRFASSTILAWLLRVLKILSLACINAKRALRGSVPCVGEELGPPAFVDLDGSGLDIEDLLKLGERIGEGSFGKVYACHFSQGIEFKRHPLCVKVVRRSASKKLDDPVSQLLKELDHPNIVQYHCFAQTPEALYIIMDRCEGPELLDHVEAQGSVSFDAVRDIVHQMLSAVAAVHAASLMHRDLKPQNFCFRDAAASTLRLIDFGSAAVSGPEPTAHSVTGTLVYAAPEVFSGVYSCQCDLWSVGVILFLLIAGHVPFETSDLAILQSMHRDPVLTGDSLLRGERWRLAPAGAQSLARGLLNVDPNSRLSGAAALEHRWFAASREEEDLVAARTSTSALTRTDDCGTLVEMKRSGFMWNLAECEGSESDGQSEPLKQSLHCDHSSRRRRTSSGGLGG